MPWPLQTISTVSFDHPRPTCYTQRGESESVIVMLGAALAREHAVA
jgi:hypothetical protein